jgi:hypothetical protein
VFFNRLGDIRDRSFEQRRNRASGRNLVTVAIVLWDTVYRERAVTALRGHGQTHYEPIQWLEAVSLAIADWLVDSRGRGRKLPGSAVTH